MFSLAPVFSSKNEGGAVAVASSTYPAGTLNTVAPGSALTLNRSGYLYIWVSNETQNWDVFFDNLSVQHKQGPMLEENHYYPFGLAMAGISDKALKPNYTENKYRFNSGSELQNKEFSDGSGLELYDANARMYDPQIGRFGGIDVLSGTTMSISSYSFGFDDPVMFNDPTGMKVAPKNMTSQQMADWVSSIKKNFNYNDVAEDGGDGGGSGGGGGFYSYMDNQGNFWHHPDPLAGTPAQGMQYQAGNGIDGFGGLAEGIVANAKSGYSNGQFGYFVSWAIPGGAPASGNTFGKEQTLSEVRFAGEFVAVNNNYGGEINGWGSTSNLTIGSLATGWGAKENLINYAAKFDVSINDLKYVKGVKVLSKGLFAAQVLVSGYQAANAWKNSDGDWSTNDGNKWGVTGKAALDVTMGAIGTFGGPVGWVIAGTYFLGDAAGLWGHWGDAPD